MCSVNSVVVLKLARKEKMGRSSRKIEENIPILIILLSRWLGIFAIAEFGVERERGREKGLGANNQRQ